MLAPAAVQSGWLKAAKLASHESEDVFDKEEDKFKELTSKLDETSDDEEPEVEIENTAAPYTRVLGQDRLVSVAMC